MERIVHWGRDGGAICACVGGSVCACGRRAPPGVCKSMLRERTLRWYSEYVRSCARTVRVGAATRSCRKSPEALGARCVQCGVDDGARRCAQALAVPHSALQVMCRGVLYKVARWTDVRTKMRTGGDRSQSHTSFVRSRSDHQ